MINLTIFLEYLLNYFLDKKTLNKILDLAKDIKIIGLYD